MRAICSKQHVTHFRHRRGFRLADHRCPVCGEPLRAAQGYLCSQCEPVLGCGNYPHPRVYYLDKNATHCPQGHALTVEDNPWMAQRGQRRRRIVCAVCGRRRVEGRTVVWSTAEQAVTDLLVGGMQTVIVHPGDPMCWFHHRPSDGLQVSPTPPEDGTCAA